MEEEGAMTLERLQEMDCDELKARFGIVAAEAIKVMKSEIERLALELTEERRLRQIETGYANRTVKAEAENAKLREALPTIKRDEDGTVWLQVKNAAINLTA